MRAAAALSFAVLLAASVAHADCEPHWSDLPADAPKFETYPARVPVFRPRPPEVVHNRDARAFRTVLRREAKTGVDFAGHYKLARIGCGAGCVSPAVIDLRSGKVTFDPAFGTVVWAPGIFSDFERLEHRRNSRLLMVSGMLDEDEHREGVFYYLWDGRQLKLIQHYDFGRICKASAAN